MEEINADLVTGAGTIVQLALDPWPARSDAALAARIEDVRKRDALGFEFTEYFRAMSYDWAVSSDVVAEGVTREQWEEGSLVREHAQAELLDQMLEYLGFAYDKVVDHRGLSALRSIGHYKAWFWLLGDRAFDSVEWSGGRGAGQYGAGILLRLATGPVLGPRGGALVVGGWQAAAGDSWEKFSRMARGEECSASGCDSGCEA